MPGGGARPAGPPRRSPRSRRGRGGSPGHGADTESKRRDGRAARRRGRAQVQPRRRRRRIEQRRRGRRAQGGQAAGCHLAQPAPLHLPVEGIPAPARAPPVPGGQPGAGEPGRGVARAGVPGRVGERLYRQHDLVVQLQVVAGQPGQRPGQHRRGQIGRPPGSTQNRCWPASIGSRSRRSASDQPITVSRAVHRSTADPYPASATQAPSSTATCRTTDPNSRGPSQ